MEELVGMRARAETRSEQYCPHQCVETCEMSETMILAGIQGAPTRLEWSSVLKLLTSTSRLRRFNVSWASCTWTCHEDLYIQRHLLCCLPVYTVYAEVSNMPNSLLL